MGEHAMKVLRTWWPIGIVLLAMTLSAAVTLSMTLLSAAHAEDVTCALAPDGYTHCFNARGDTVMTSQQSGEYTRSWTKNGRTETCWEHNGSTRCWRTK
jgi:hypothetical protein